MRVGMSGLVVGVALALGCSNETPRATPLPTEVDGLGALDDDCVQRCRELFESCSTVEACYAVTGCGSFSLSECTARCADGPAINEALTEAGCFEAYVDYQSCVTLAVRVDGVCELRDDHCGAEWGVYASCAGL